MVFIALFIKLLMFSLNDNTGGEIVNFYKALASIVLMIFLFFTGSREEAFEKDFFYFNPSNFVRRCLYIKKIPKGLISLTSLAMQCLIIFTVILQVLSICGTNFLEPILSLVWFGKYTFMNPDNPYLQTGFCVAFIFFPGALLILTYFLFCSMFAPNRYR